MSEPSLTNEGMLEYHKTFEKKSFLSRKEVTMSYQKLFSILSLIITGSLSSIVKEWITPRKNFCWNNMSIDTKNFIFLLQYIIGKFKFYSIFNFCCVGFLMFNKLKCLNL